MPKPKPRVKAGTSKRAGLTAKQEAFAVAVAKGMSASDAYRSAYDASKTKPDVIHVKASQLMANGKLAVRIAELRAPALEAAQVDVDRWVKEISKYAFDEPSKGLRHADKRGYLDMMARSLGAYEKDNAQQQDSLVLNVSAAVPVKR